MIARPSLAAGLAREEEHSEPQASGVVETSFESVYHHYFDFVWSTTRRLGVSPGSVDDVVQEIFLVIHAKLPTLRQAHSLRSWIYGIARRTASHHHRSQRTKTTKGEAFAIEADVQRSTIPTPLDATEQNDQVKLLWSLLEKLDPLKREVFILAELEEMTAPEIAEGLEIPLNTAYSRLRAARQAFEELLARTQAENAGKV